MEFEFDLNLECYKRGWRNQRSTRERVDLYHRGGRKEPMMNYLKERRIYSEGFVNFGGISDKPLDKNEEC